MKFRDILEAKTITIYHGDNYGTKKLEPKYMFQENSNNQEGVGIYFGNIETAKSYGKNIVSTEINPKNFVNSREPISKVVSDSVLRKFLKEISKLDIEEFYYLITDYGIEVKEPEDVTDKHITEFVQYIKNEEVRNFQITFCENFGVIDFVNLWNKIIKIHGTYFKQPSDTWYAIINTNYNLKNINI